MTTGPMAGWGFGGNIVLVKNTSGATVPRWGVLSISGVQINPNSGNKQRRQYESMPCLTGDTPSSKNDKFVIPIEPIKNNAIGRAAVAGVTVVKLTEGDDEYRFAKPKAGNKSALEAANDGPARILWRNENWGLVRLGDAAQLRLCKTGSQWPVGGTQTLQVYENYLNFPEMPPDLSPGETISAYNSLYPVAADVYVIVCKVRDEWHLVSAGSPEITPSSQGYCFPANIGGQDLTVVSGYNGGTTQVLGHENGCLQWFNTQECPPPPPSGGE